MSTPGLAADIEAGAEALGLSLRPTDGDRLATLLAELARWNRRFNLTAIRTPQEMVAAHVLDSLAVRPWLGGATVLDIGTGAGFPGLPLAVTEPGRWFTLLDGNGKKIRFVRHMIATLALANVEAVQSRAEDYAPGTRFDTVIARALGGLPRLAELGGRQLADDGVLLALKGKYPAEELDALPADWIYDVTELTVPGLGSHARHLVVMRRAEGAPT